MKSFEKYVEQLHQLTTDVASRNWQLRCKAALDGEASGQLRLALDLATRRADGAFFTGSKLAAKVFAGQRRITSPNDAVFDPACGAGDLLLAYAWGLPTERTVEATLRRWGCTLSGRDKHYPFVRAARVRLCLLAQARLKAQSASISEQKLRSLLPNLKVGDGLKLRHSYRQANWIIMNPPFVTAASGAHCRWAGGGVNSAALFFDHCLASMHVGDRITAVLPDVLRAGSRYAAWRTVVAKRLASASLCLYGPFDRLADVDVFILDGVRGDSRLRHKRIRWNPKPAMRQKRIGDHFDVSVGAVVPHRLDGTGKWQNYIHARAAPRWKEIRTILGRIRFDGMIHKGPFVLIRRTSSPSDKSRAVATVLTSAVSVAVENHLIVCRPKNGQLGDCRKLARQLKDGRTTAFLNKRIRCRHLTVGAVREIPC